MALEVSLTSFAVFLATIVDFWNLEGQVSQPPGGTATVPGDHLSLKFDYFCAIFADNNECTLSTHNCHNKATCSNTDGSFTCVCNTGYNGNGVTCAGKQSADSSMISLVPSFMYI